MTCREKPVFYTEYHQEIAGYIADFGGRVLEAVSYVVEGRITRSDLVRIIGRHHLIDRLGGRASGFFKNMADYIAQSQFPFNRNSLSEESLLKLTTHISGLFKGNPLLIPREITSQILKLCKKGGNGCLCLDISDIENNFDIIEEVGRFAQEKAERKQEQNRAANQKYKKNKKKKE